MAVQFRVRIINMPSSYVSLLYHIVYSTKYRKRCLKESLRLELQAYIGGIIANKHGQLLEIGGMPDHLHILTSCSPRIALADFVRDIKANSSKWMHEEKGQTGFAWQTGYGAFTVSCSQGPTVRAYVRNQAQHHRELSFEDEFRSLLQRHGIAFEERYLFEKEYIG
jgi:putative transposase